MQQSHALLAAAAREFAAAATRSLVDMVGVTIGAAAASSSPNKDELDGLVALGSDEAMPRSAKRSQADRMAACVYRAWTHSLAAHVVSLHSQPLLHDGPLFHLLSS